MLRKNTDTNVIEYYDGTVWKDLTAAGGGGGAWSFVSSADASSSPSLDFTSLSSTKSIEFQLEDIVPANDAVAFAARTSADNGSNWDAGATDYAWVTRMQEPSATSTGGNAGESRMRLTESGSVKGVGNGVNEKLDGWVRLTRPGGSGYTTMQFEITYSDPDGNIQSARGSGRRLSAAAANGLRFLFTSGNIASGTIRMYELAQS